MWPLITCVAVDNLCAVGRLCGGWQAVWQLAICTPLAIRTPLASCVAVGKLYTVSKLCGSWQAVWQWISFVAVGKLCGSGVSCVIVGKLYDSGQAVYR